MNDSLRLANRSAILVDAYGYCNIFSEKNKQLEKVNDYVNESKDGQKYQATDR